MPIHQHQVVQVSWISDSPYLSRHEIACITSITIQRVRIQQKSSHAKKRSSGTTGLPRSFCKALPRAVEKTSLSDHLLTWVIYVGGFGFLWMKGIPHNLKCYIENHQSRAPTDHWLKKFLMFCGGGSTRGASVKVLLLDGIQGAFGGQYGCWMNIY